MIISHHGIAMLGGATTFLTVMRANQAYGRYERGSHMMCLLGHEVRSIFRIAVTYSKGTGDNYELTPESVKGMEELWVNLIRLCLAFLLCVNMKARIGYKRAIHGLKPLVIDEKVYKQLSFDRARLRGVLYPHEWQEVDEMLGRICYPSNDWCDRPGKPRIDFPDFNDMEYTGNIDSETSIRSISMKNVCDPAILIGTLIGWEIMKHLTKSYGYVERVLNYFENRIDRMLFCFQEMEQNMSMHFPFCFAQMNKVLLLMFFFWLPCDLPSGEGRTMFYVFFCGVVSFIYFGIEYVGIAIEVPYGQDDMDINMLRTLHFFECESMSMMKMTEDKMKLGRKYGEWPHARSYFTWNRIPEGYDQFHEETIVGGSKLSCKKKEEVGDGWCLALKSEVNAAMKVRDEGWCLAPGSPGRSPSRGRRELDLLLPENYDAENSASRPSGLSRVAAL
eukprot:gnl/MRDRNA2_/MRDRNA2_134794_c0_seq1.p1 gnl/MRDRNA2_/MRDRNA2_134794_c0~~gnl/MRDRNA2_/MRDRNA2_134794_c0_seq1.p1  ORF type:complete len:511 (+),score=63.12 gnl/MRDRNA2_/MRDRNA2_134794_c0_seq1:195-1535(+)